MKLLWKCRRTFIAGLGIVALTGLGVLHGTDISGIALAISGIVGAVAGSNAWEKRSKNEYGSDGMEDK
jgi:hypothetical protein